MQSPLRWAVDPAWKLDYCNVERTAPSEIARLRAENEQARLIARAIRTAS
jgi:hypothetical protein